MALASVKQKLPPLWTLLFIVCLKQLYFPCLLVPWHQFDILDFVATMRIVKKKKKKIILQGAECLFIPPSICCTHGICYDPMLC